MNRGKDYSRENTNVEILTRWQDPTIEELKNQLVTDTEKAIKDLQQRVEQLENIRKEAIEWVEHNQYYFPRPNDLLNILNKGSNKE